MKRLTYSQQQNLFKFIIPLCCAASTRKASFHGSLLYGSLFTRFTYIHVHVHLYFDVGMACIIMYCQDSGFQSKKICLYTRSDEKLSTQLLHKNFKVLWLVSFKRRRYICEIMFTCTYFVPMIFSSSILHFYMFSTFMSLEDRLMKFPYLS